MKQTNPTTVIVVLLSMIITGSIAQAAQKLEAGPGSTATFEAIGRPALLKIKGHGAEVDGSVDVETEAKEKGVTGEFQIDLSGFTTGIETRDKHMKENYLEVEKFPKAILKVESVSIPSGWKLGEELKETTFKGALTIKGEAKPVEGKVSVGTGEMPAKAEFVMKISDYPSLGVPKYMGITVADAVTVQVEVPKFLRK